jgi:hypothetical protein
MMGEASPCYCQHVEKGKKGGGKKQKNKKRRKKKNVKNKVHHVMVNVIFPPVKSNHLYINRMIDIL